MATVVPLLELWALFSSDCRGWTPWWSLTCSTAQTDTLHTCCTPGGARGGLISGLPGISSHGVWLELCLEATQKCPWIPPDPQSRQGAGGVVRPVKEPFAPGSGHQ